MFLFISIIGLSIIAGGALAAPKQTAVICLDRSTGNLTIVDAQRCEAGRTTIVTGILENAINETGWGYLNVEVVADDIDEIQQAYAAGLVEGHLTKSLIDMHWQNTIGDYCHNQKDFCQRLMIFLKKNYDWMTKQITLHHNDTYWKQVNFSLVQLQGIAAGFEGNWTALGDSIVTHPIYLLQLSGDVNDLYNKLNPNHTVFLRSKTLKWPGHCSALIKLAPNNTDLLVSHVTWEGYGTMLRLQKRYAFRLDTKKYPGHTKILSGYPGILSSVDDYVHLSSNMVVTETTIINFNRSLDKLIVASSVFSWIRVQIAHRMAKSGRTWAHIFGRFNSGTYNNQWMIIDWKRFNVGHRKQSTGLLHVLEQLPYFPKIFALSAAPDMVAKYGTWFSYDKCPRAQIFDRDQANVVDMPSLEKLMRYNNFQKDPLSHCNCTPPYTGFAAISARGDLNPQNGTYPFPDLGFSNSGGVDMKAANLALMKAFKFRAISGPTHDDVPVFDWRTNPLSNSVKHIGHPDVWNFAAVEYDLGKMQADGN